MFEIIMILAVYLLPSIIAVARDNSNKGPTIVVNLFLGWTIIGWIISLAMCFDSNKPRG